MTLPTCQCRSVVDYIVTAADIPEANPDEFVDYPVHVSCGTNVSKGKQFAPGHDAKYKSVLIKAFRAGGDFAWRDGSMLHHADPMALAKERGWERFLTPAKARKARSSLKGKGSKAAKAAQGQAEPDSDQPVAGFRPCQVKVGRWWKDGNVSAIHADGTVTVVYSDSKGDQKTITVDADKVKAG